jgi:protein-S-isoprenylcysteine O-methyltransferase Ste14
VPILATSGLLAFVVVAFGLRTWMHVRATGSTGFAGVRRGAGPLERVAAVAMVLAYAGVPIGAWVGTPLFGLPVAMIGITLALLGIAGTFAAQVTMRESWRIGVAPSERTRLVTSGLFRWVRNPIFTMMIVVSLGLALTCSTPIALVLPWVLVAALEVQVRMVEEPYLVGVHGEAYLAWAQQTGRFVPWIGRLRATPRPGVCHRPLP